VGVVTLYGRLQRHSEAVLIVSLGRRVHGVVEVRSELEWVSEALSPAEETASWTPLR
jgi:hypothetical protein